MPFHCWSQTSTCRGQWTTQPTAGSTCPKTIKPCGVILCLGTSAESSRAFATPTLNSCCMYGPCKRLIKSRRIFKWKRSLLRQYLSDNKSVCVSARNLFPPAAASSQESEDLEKEWPSGASDNRKAYKLSLALRSGLTATTQQRSGEHETLNSEKTEKLTSLSMNLFAKICPLKQVQNEVALFASTNYKT